MYKLSKSQNAIYEMDRFVGGSVANISGDIFFPHELDSNKMVFLIKELLINNPIFFTKIRVTDNCIMQEIDTSNELMVKKIFFNSDEDYFDWARTEAQKPIDIYDHLYFITVCTVAEKGIYINIRFHHIIGDAWSVGIMAKYLKNLYKGNYIESYSYQEYLVKESEYLCSEKYLQDKKYWLSLLENQKEINYFSEKQIKSYESKRKNYELSDVISNKIKVFCKHNNLSEYAFFLCVISIYYYRILGKSKFYIGTPILNRLGKREKNIIGPFINTIPIAVSLTESDELRCLVQNITHQIVEGFRHQKYHFTDLLKELREEKHIKQMLFDVIVSFQNMKVEEYDSNWYFQGMQTESLQIHIDDRENRGKFSINYDYLVDRFSNKEIEIMHGHLQTIIESILKSNDIKIDNIQIITDEEYKKVIYEFNSKKLINSKTFFESFNEQIVCNGNKVAIENKGEEITFSDFNNMANKVATLLTINNIQKNDIVVLLLPRDIFLLIAMMGVIMTGAAYLPIDPKYPNDRIEYLINESKAVAIITSDDYKIVLKEEIKIYFKKHFDSIESSEISIEHENNDLFCVLHTSGSTGRPKLAMLTYGNICSFNNATKYLFEGVNNSLSTTTVSFDAFLQETLIALSNGIRVILFSENEIGNQKEFEQIVEKYNNSFIFQTPTKLEAYIHNSVSKNFLKHLSIILLGGEVFPKKLFVEIRKYTSAIIENNHFSNTLNGFSSIDICKKIRIVNGYGPTETTMGVCYAELEEFDMTIGKPIANTQIYILDKSQNPMPIGITGEICIAGDGVGKGYLNRPELTEEKFIKNPFGFGKIYRTGDLGRWRDDGSIEYIGRDDFQIKIRGLRIELGEIENIIKTYPGVNRIAVVVQKDAAGRQYICAFYIGENINTLELREEIGKKLPKYMIPHFFIELDDFPITFSGKIDRNALPILKFEDISIEENYVEPKTELEKKLCSIVSNILAVTRVGIVDNFFEIGGDSLKAIEYVARSQAENIYFTVQNVFDYPTVVKLSDYITSGEITFHKYSKDDFTEIEKILAANKIDELFKAEKIKYNDILITGATGFLGAHLVDVFLKSEIRRIYCLVRGNEAEKRLYDTLKYYHGDCYLSEFKEKIVVIQGDIVSSDFSELSIPNVDLIIHAAASVKHYGTYKYFYEINTVGTKNIIKLAYEKNAKLIHVSTLSVSGNSMADQFDTHRSLEPKEFIESSLYISQPLDNVYIRSKFEAEKAVFEAMSNGLRANVVRVGNLTNRITDGKFQINYKENAFLNRLKAVLEFGLFPDYLIDLYAEFSPVDETAKGIQKIAEYFNCHHTTFHLNNHKVVYFDKLIEMLGKLKINMTIVNDVEFALALEQVSKAIGNSHIYDALSNDMDKNKRLVYDSNIKIKNEYTRWYMNKIGFEWSEIEIKYIKNYIEYFRKVGYLKV